MTQAARWDPEVLNRIGHLHLRARAAVAGLQHGAFRSNRVAANVEFADYKEYSPGDPLRDLDWRVAARTDRLVVRRHHAETEMRAMLLLDASGDMGTGAHGRVRRPPLEGSKFGFALTLTATLVYFLHLQGEPVGLQILGGRDVRWPFIPPRAGASHLAQIFGALASLAPGGRAELGRGLRALGARLPRRALVVVVSDLMEEPASWAPSLLSLAARRADLRAAHIYDRQEWALDYRQPLRLFSPEGGEALPVDPVGAREVFSEVVSEYTAEVRAAFVRQRGHHVLAATDAPLEQILARVLVGW